MPAIDLGTFHHWFAFMCSQEVDAVDYREDWFRPLTEKERAERDYIEHTGDMAARRGDELGAEWKRSMDLLHGVGHDGSAP